MYIQQQYNTLINSDFFKSEKPCASNWDSRGLIMKKEHGTLE